MSSLESLPCHPFEILNKEFLIPLNISWDDFLKDTGLCSNDKFKDSSCRDTSVITVECAIRLSLYFGNSIGFWLNLQIQYDVAYFEMIDSSFYNKIKLCILNMQM